MENRVIANRYKLLNSLGLGGFGQVFRAEDTTNGKHVAIKLLHPMFETDHSVLDGFRQEAGRLAILNHSHILDVLSFDFSGSPAYLVTQLAEGGSLARQIQPDPDLPPWSLPTDQILHYLAQIADALDEAHAQGIIHRDIKPENILLDAQNNVLLADFGLALTVSRSATMRRFSTLWGTAEYVAPEVWRNQAAPASDLYALGIVVYQMLTGQTPFTGDMPTLLNAHLNDEVPPLAEIAPHLEFPPALDNVMQMVLAKDPANRPETAGVFYQLFRAALLHNTWPPIEVPARPAKPASPVGNPQMAALMTRLLRAEHVADWETVIRYGENLLIWDIDNQEVQRKLSDAYQARGIALHEKRQYTDAIAAFNRAIELNDTAPDYYNWRGKSLAANKQFEAAINDMRHATELDPAHFDATSQIAEYAASIDDCTKITRIVGRNAAIYARAAELRLAYAHSLAVERYDATMSPPMKAISNEYDAALNDIGYAIELDPQNTQYYLLRACTYSLVWGGASLQFTNEFYKAAIADYTTALKLDPDLSYVTPSSRNEHLFKVAKYNLLLKTDPTSAFWYFERGLSLMTLQNYRPAVEDFGKALEFGFDPAQCYYQRGLAYIVLKDKRAARKDLDEASRLGVEDAKKARRDISWF